MQTPPTSPGDGSATPAQASVLLVDDGPENRVLLAAILTRAGYRVLVAEDGASGLALLGREKVDLMVLDYMMPGMDGAEVARRVRGQHGPNELPIIMLTASQEEPHIEAAFAAGANDYLTKPIDRRILVARVAAIIKAAEDHRRAEEAAEFEGEHRSLLTEMKEAANIQQARLPRLPVKTRGWAVSGALVPSRHIGGDSLDVMADRNGGQVVAVVDVSGHGLAAALVAAAVCVQLRELVARYPLAESVGLLNQQLCREEDGKYACLAVFALEEQQTAVINAGLPPVCLIRGGVCLARFEGSGTPPGLVAGASYEPQVCDVLPGDRLVMMSDGLTEPFGSADRVLPALQEIGLLAPDLQVEHLAGSALAERIGALLRKATTGELDDATLVVAQRLGGRGLV